jgi:hypothetical protein
MADTRDSHDRWRLKNNYLLRAAGIVLGGNAQPKQEVIYPVIVFENVQIRDGLLIRRLR